jgi:hypothetical protein
VDVEGGDTFFISFNNWNAHSKLLSQ